jgi:hypothetical protein
LSQRSAILLSFTGPNKATEFAAKSVCASPGAARRDDMGGVRNTRDEWLFGSGFRASGISARICKERFLIGETMHPATRTKASESADGKPARRRIRALP